MTTNAPNLRLNWMVAIALAGWLLWLLAPVLTPFVASALLAYIGDPLADRLQKFRLPRTVAVIVVFLLTFLALALLVLLVLPLIRDQVSAFLMALPGIITQAEQVWLPTLTEFLGIEPGEDIGLGAFMSRYSDMAGNWTATVLLSLSRGGGALAAAVISLFLVPILTFYLLRDWDMIILRMGALVPSRQRDTVFQLARETDDVLGAFLRGQLLVMTGLAIIYSTGLSLVGLKFAIAIGVVAGLVSFVPYLGFVFGILLAGLTVVLEPDPVLRLAGVVATFAIGQFIEGSVLTPKLVGDRIGLHPVIVIFAVAAGGQLFGFFGILLALPAAAVLSVIARFAYLNYLAEHPVEAEILKVMEPGPPPVEAPEDVEA
ncbi:MAG: AI-2E family transporter [Gammaproteobacteria bacterium]|nr:AI-2E family transporter [Gammaproteobacteria bacterium]